MNENQRRVTIPQEAAGMRLSEYLAQNGYPLNAPCGGRGVCGKCRVTILSGMVSTEANQYVPPRKEDTTNSDVDGAYDVLACRVYCTEAGAEIQLPIHCGSGLTAFAGDQVPESEQAVLTKKETGIALDIGTTTLAAAIVELRTKKVLHTVSCLNPQQSFGADVISRIQCVMENGESLFAMQKVLLTSVRELIDQLLPYAPQCPPKMMSVVGNTTMLHLFCGISPVGMGAYPFTPVFTDEKLLDGSEIGLPVKTVMVLPSASAFIGSDITAGIYMSRIMESEMPAALMDIGTNGEMALFTGTKFGGKLYAASAAAGPAMEGAGISTGVGGIPGAVCSVRSTAATAAEHQWIVRTIENAPPVGICGSGLIDLIACMCDLQLIDETGYMDEEECAYAECNVHPLTITQEDIRAFQLAKSAIRAGFIALCDTAGLTESQITRIDLAGGLGYYMNPDSAMRVGLLPDNQSAGCRTQIRSIGNSALAGAIQRLCVPTVRAEISRIASECETVELNDSPLFSEAFIEQMMFNI